jgi:sulfide:quinone oxidoreductase
MEIKSLSSDLSVAPQISPEDVNTIAAEGFRTLINNRPNGEAPGQPSGDTIAQASESAGLDYKFQPVISGGFTLQDVEEFGQLLEAAEKPALAYCRTGTRCTMLWALSQAGKMDTDDIIEAAENAGYDLSGMRGQINHLAEQRNS